MDLIKLGGIISVLISILTLLGKLKPITDKVNEVIDTVTENSEKITNLSDEVVENKKITTKIAEQQQKIDKSIKDVLRQHLLDLMNPIISRGWMTDEEQFQIDELYKDYKDLNGNFMIDTKYKVICKLPVRNGGLKDEN